MRVSPLALSAVAFLATTTDLGGGGVAVVEGFSMACAPQSLALLLRRRTTALYGYNFSNNESNDPTMDAYRRAMREVNGGLNVPDWDRKFGSTNSLRDGKLDARGASSYYYNNDPADVNRMGLGGGGLIPDQDDGGRRTSSIFPPSDRVSKTREALNGQRIYDGGPEQVFGGVGVGGPPPGGQFYSPGPPPEGAPGARRMPPGPPPPRPGANLNNRRRNNNNRDTKSTNIFGQEVESLGKNRRRGEQPSYPRAALPQSRAQYIPTTLGDNVNERAARRGVGPPPPPQAAGGGNRFNRDLYGVGSGLSSPSETMRQRRNADMNRRGDNMRRNNVITVEPERINGSNNDYLNNLNNRPGFNNTFSSRSNNPLQREASSPASRNNIRNQRNSNERINSIGGVGSQRRAGGNTINSVGRRPYETDGVPWDVKARQEERRQRNQFGAVGNMFSRGGRNGRSFDDSVGAPPIRERDRIIVEADNTAVDNNRFRSSDRYIRSDNPLNYEGYTSVSQTLGRPNGMGGTRDGGLLNGNPNNNGMRRPPYTPNARRAPGSAAGVGRRPGGRDGMQYYDDDRRNGMFDYGGRGQRSGGNNNGGASLAAAILIGVPLALFVGPQYLDNFPAIRDNLPKSVVDYTRDFNKNVEKSLRKTGFDVTLPTSNFQSTGALRDKISDNSQQPKKPAAPAPAAPKPAEKKVTAADIEKQLNAVKAPPAPAAAPKPAPAPAPAPAAKKQALTPEEILKQLDEIKVGYTPQQQGDGTAGTYQQQQQQQQYYMDAYNHNYMNGGYDHSTQQQQQQPGYVSNDYNSVNNNNAQQHGEHYGAHQPQQQQQQYQEHYNPGGDSSQQQYAQAYNSYVATATSANNAAQQQQQQHQHQEYHVDHQHYVQGGSEAQQPSQHHAEHNNYWSTQNAQTQYENGYEDYSMF